jgi:hypothetical protein
MADIAKLLETILANGREEDEKEERRQKRRRAILQGKKRLARQGRRDDDREIPMSGDVVRAFDADAEN